MNRTCIVSAKRTPQGRLMGALAKFSAVDLAIAAGKAALTGINTHKIDQTIIGNVIAAGQGMNVARQTALNLGIPIERPAFAINMVCASGMHAVALAAQAIMLGEAETILCGGTESMSNVPYLLSRARGGYRLGDGVLIDGLLRDGLVDSFSNEHMALTAERIAEKYKITRKAQDEFALGSHFKWADAQAKKKFDDELIKVGKLEFDEHPRPDTTLEKLASLQPVFKENGTVTAGNASGINDGAAMLVVCDEETAKKNNWQPLAYIRAWTSIGCDPQLMGLGPIYAVKKLCKKEKLSIKDFDTIELNEAFAAQVLACIKELKIDKERLNPEGGAIALGHPVGTSGARLIVHLAHRIQRGETNSGLATLCVGGGMGMAMVLESP